MTIPAPVAAWGFNKDLGESAGQYKDYIGGLILASNDGLDHPASAAKVGAGAYQGANLATRKLFCQTVPPINSGPYTVSIWWRAASLSSVTDRIFELNGGEIALQYNRSISVQRVVFAYAGATNYQNISPQDTNWHHSLLVISAPYNAPEDPEDPESPIIPWWDWTPYLDGVAGTPLSFWVGQSLAASIFVCGISQYFNGDVDALHIWQEALTPEQVAEVYNAGTGWEYAPPDPTPDAFDFTDVTDADLSTVYESDSQSVTGMDAGTAISITGGEYRINGGAWTSDAGTIDPGDTLELRLTSSGTPETEATATVTVGTLAVDWSVTTGTTMTVEVTVGASGKVNISGATQVVIGGNCVFPQG